MSGGSNESERPDFRQESDLRKLQWGSAAYARICGEIPYWLYLQ